MKGHCLKQVFVVCLQRADARNFDYAKFARAISVSLDQARVKSMLSKSSRESVPPLSHKEKLEWLVGTESKMNIRPLQEPIIPDVKVNITHE